mmetsp:Transcript_45025/g.104274  ORF Transcript_45025/g.104274 Transcript_45025/m.104274 type:complete len:537 (-) Transcript_45025:47-1657(-)
MHWISILAPLAYCLFQVNAAESSAECSASSSPQSGDVLIQRSKASVSVHADAEELFPGRTRGKFANLLAKEMNDLVVAKGQSGLSPEEIEHIHTIKDLIMNSIIPSIADGVADSKAELDELYQAVTECALHVTDALGAVDSLENATDTNRGLHKDCRKHEDDLKEDKEEACKELEKAELGVHAPELDFELGIDMSDEEMLKYLRAMNEHFCGRWKEFEETWEECEDLTDNHTGHRDKCDNLQEDFEESFCAWKSELEATCKNFDKCWTEAVGRFNERKQAIETLQESRMEEYEAAVKVNCLWDAWKWEADPCTVDEEKVKECTENLHPNLTNVSLEIPELPTPPECDVDAVSVHPCTDEFLEEEYATLGVAPEIVEDMKSKCTACPEPVVPRNNSVAELQKTGISTSLANLMAVAGSMYVKTGGQPGKCDGVVSTPQGSTAAVKVTVLQASSKVEVSLSDGDHSHKMLLENDVASAGDESVLFSADEDTMGIAIANGKVQYLKAGKPFAEEPASFTLGSANVALCTVGASVDVKFA